MNSSSVTLSRDQKQFGFFFLIVFLKKKKSHKTKRVCLKMLVLSGFSEEFLRKCDKMFQLLTLFLTSVSTFPGAPDVVK